MKKIIILVIALMLPFIAISQERPFVLSGKMHSDTLCQGTVYLSYNDNGKELRDSSPITDNMYRFSGRILDGAVMLNLFWRDPASQGSGQRKLLKGFAKFYITPGHAEAVHGQKFSDYQVDGSDVQLQNELLNQQLTVKGSSKMPIKIRFIQDHPESWLSYILLEKLVRAKEIDPALGEQLFNGLRDDLKSHRQLSALKNLLNGQQIAITGRIAMDFTENDPHGRPVSLSSYRGRYVLIDFWASWCHPCRAENPFLAKALLTYKNRGFDILGVSMDGGPAARKHWLDAVEQDHVAWAQVSNLKGFDDEIAISYGVTSLPRNFLIDPEGKIIAMDLRGGELEKKLNEIL